MFFRQGFATFFVQQPRSIDGDGKSHDSLGIDFDSRSIILISASGTTTAPGTTESAAKASAGTTCSTTTDLSPSQRRDQEGQQQDYADPMTAVHGQSPPVLSRHNLTPNRHLAISTRCVGRGPGPDIAADIEASASERKQGPKTILWASCRSFPANQNNS